MKKDQNEHTREMEKIKNKHELDLREQANRDKEVDAQIESLKEKDKRELLKINH